MVARIVEPGSPDRGGRAGGAGSAGGAGGWSSIIGGIARDLSKIVNQQSRRDILRDIEKKYGRYSAQYRSAAARYPLAAAKREAFSKKRAAEGRLTRTARQGLKKVLKSPQYAQFRKYIPAVLRGQAPKIAAAIIGVGNPIVSAVLGVLYPSVITPEVPIPRTVPGPGTRPPSRPPAMPGAPGVPGNAPPAGSRMPTPIPGLPLPSWPGTVPAPVAKAPPLPKTTTQNILDWILKTQPLWQPFLMPSPRTTSRRSTDLGIGQGPSVFIDPLTSAITGALPFSLAQPAPAESLAEQCRAAAKRKRGKRKFRNVCYRGTYTERRSGLSKKKLRKVPCK